MIYLTGFILAIAVSAAMSRAMITLCDRYEIYDIPDGRKLPRSDTGKLGGIGIASGFIVPFALLAYHHRVAGGAWFLLSSIALTIAFGAYDDWKGMRVSRKIAFQIAAGALLALSGCTITEFRFLGQAVHPGIWSYGFTVFWALCCMNAVNLIDGIDGLAALLAVIANVFLFIISLILWDETIAGMSLLLAGSSLAFLFYNFPPARIFMGDNGAYFLGLMYAYATLSLVNSGPTALPLFAAITILFVPFFDVLMVMAIRIRAGKSILAADMNHLHHRLGRLGFSATKTALLLGSVTTALGAAAVVMMLIPETYALAVFFAAAAVIAASFAILDKCGKRGASG